MSKKVVNTGASANDGTGDFLRDAMVKINDNFSEIYTTLGDGSNLELDVNSETFNNQPPSYYLNYNNLTNKPTDLSDFDNAVGFVTASVVNGYATETYVDNGLNLKASLSGAVFSGAIVGTTITGDNIVIDGGTGSQFLKADGTLDSNVYLTSESDTLSSVTTRGSSTTNNITVGNLNASAVTATSFTGDGSGLTGVTAEGNGITIKNNSVTLGITSSINFGSNVTGTFSAGVATVTVADIELANDPSPTLSADLDLTSNDIVGSGNINITGVVTATTFSGTFVGGGSNLANIPNSSLDNSTISIGGITFNLGDTDATPALDLSDATNYPFTSLTGITTEIQGDASPQLGGDLDINGQNITGSGSINISGNVTATSFSGSGAGLTAIPNSSLVNSTISIGGTIVGLGSTNPTPVLDLTNAINYPFDSIVGVTTEIRGDSSPQLGGDLDLNSSDITGSGNISIAGSFTGSGIGLTAIPNSSLDHSTVSYGGIQVSLGSSDPTPAFDLTDAINYPYTSLTGVTTEISADATPQLGGDLDLNSNDITGVGNINISGSATADLFDGRLKRFPQNLQASAYTLLSTDSGQHVAISTGGVAITTSTLFGVGDISVIYNDSEFTQNITAGAGVTFYQVSIGTTSTIGISTYGVANILCIRSNEYKIYGSDIF